MRQNIPHTWHSLKAETNCQNRRWIAGTDEVGRGPLAGPVVATVVVVAPDFELPGLTDSKALSRRHREELFDALTTSNKVHYSISVVSESEIDRVNILQASLMAMRQAVESVSVSPEILFIDGNREIPNLSILNGKQQAVIGGDAIVPAISAASVIAKVTRDRIMEEAEQKYPAFSFSRHVGYPTPKHLRELREHGITPLHRRSFRPVAEILESLTRQPQRT